MYINIKWHVVALDMAWTGYIQCRSADGCFLTNQSIITLIVACNIINIKVNVFVDVLLAYMKCCTANLTDDLCGYRS